MPVFTYKALDSGGQSSVGELPAPNRTAAMDVLTKKGLTPVTIAETKEHVAAPKHKATVHGRASSSEVERFIRELGNLLAGGVNLSRALHILAREASHATAKHQWNAIRDDVVGGTTLADAMARWPRSFSPVQTAMVRAGETGGFLDVVLSQIADFRARERDLKGKITGALVYPAVLATLSCAVVIFLLTFFIPNFSGLFESFHAALPTLTQYILGASDVIRRYGLWLLGGLVIIVVLVRRGLSSESGRRLLERMLLKTPGLGVVLARFALVRFCRMLGTLLGSGVSLVTALKVAREAIGNQILSDAVASSIEDVQKGASLAHSLSGCETLFPPSVSEVIAVAEESGRLDQELLRLATSNEAELDRRLRILVTLAEPALLFLMAAIVGTIVIGMLLPVFTLQDYIK